MVWICSTHSEDWKYTQNFGWMTSEGRMHESGDNINIDFEKTECECG